MADMLVTNFIKQQYGGRALSLFTGAKDYTGTENSLTFRIPSAKNAITHVVTTLTPADTYTVEFLNCHFTKNGFKREVVLTHTDVYCDQLLDIFEQETGLYATLRPRR